MKYARNGEKYDRFLDDFFGIDPSTQQPRFELVPESSDVIKKFDEIIVGVAELVGKSEGSGN